MDSAGDILIMDMVITTRGLMDIRVTGTVIIQGIGTGITDRVIIIIMIIMDMVQVMGQGGVQI